ncbi:MAG: undecaprenyl diphosphate synthase family protein [bacterium]|nr:undecaprenyl diphosphate synthase family protein [bacterium]
MNIGIIPDGNRKWAQLKNISFEESYSKGADIALDLVKSSLSQSEVNTLVFYVLSKENYQERKKEEITAISNGIRKGIEVFNKLPGIELILFGDDSPADIKNLFNLNEKLKNEGEHKKLKIIFLLNYSPSWDFETTPIRSSGLPDLDAIIRTGPSRLSGFLPYQSRNSQLYFTDYHWGDFSVEKFNEILRDYKDNYSKIIHGK